MKRFDRWFAAGAKALWRGFVLAAIMGGPAVAGAQTYPARPVTLVVGFAPGGSVDQAGRLITEPLSKLLGQPFVVENRPGAAAAIAHAYMARAPKDGYNVLVAYSTTNACSGALYSKLTWDPIKDFTPVGMIAVSPLTLAIAPSVPAKTLPEFIELLKKNPGKFNYGSSGVGSQAHIVGEMFQQATGTKMVHVPFKGSGDLMPSLMSGTIQMAFATTSAVLQQANAGKLRVLAIASMSRDPSMPDIPTANESGMPGFDADGWLGLFVPSGTPPQNTATLANALKRATDLPDVRQRLTAAGLVPAYLGPEAVAAKVRKDVEACNTAVRNAGIKLD